MSTDAGRPPRSLLIGCCVDVWSAQDGSQFSAMRRFAAAREFWLGAAGVEDVADQQCLIPNGAPWTVEFLLYRGQAERMHRPLGVLVSELLGKAGCTARDIPNLRAEAAALFDSITRGPVSPEKAI